MCTRNAKGEDLRVNSLSIVESKDSFELAWDCPSGEECCDYGCCPSGSIDWELIVVVLVIFLVVLILIITIYFFCCRKKKEEKTHRHPSPTISTLHTRVDSMRISVITDPCGALSSSHLLPSSSHQPSRPPSAPPVSSPFTPPNLPPYPLF
ncbi:hypothetical protein PMAYCL1PPCAC_18063, partial [Pristionchus mayeri]